NVTGVQTCALPISSDNECGEATEVCRRINYFGHGSRFNEILRKDSGKAHDEEHAGAGTKDAIVESNTSAGRKGCPRAPTTAHAIRVAGAKRWFESHEGTHCEQQHDN